MMRISVLQLRIEPVMLSARARAQKLAVCCGFVFASTFAIAASATGLSPETAQLSHIAQQEHGFEANTVSPHAFLTPTGNEQGTARHAGRSEVAAGDSSTNSAPDAITLQAWLQRVSQAAKDRNYSGVFVVQSGGRMVTSAIDHYVVHGHTLERVETLDGRRRILVCQNAKTQTILPDARLVVVEDHHTDFSFPRMLKMPQAHYADYYKIKQEGQERCAGFQCDVTRITPRDDLRYGYRLWTEQGTGLLVRAQTLSAQGKVLDQVAFTQLDLNPTPRLDLVSRALQGTAGFQIEHMRASLSTSQAQGWTMSKPVPGFESAGVYKRQLVLHGKPVEVTQWLFSDGLASVSLFAGPSTNPQHAGASLHMGDTNALFDRKGDWSVIVIGAVPAKTLQLFADSLARLH